MAVQRIPLVIVGAGGHGREVLDVVEAANAARPSYAVLGFVDDGAPPSDRLARRGVRLLGPVDRLREIDAEYLLGVGAPALRRRLDERLTGWGRAAATVVHPSAVIGGDVALGPGTVVAALASVTTNVRTGRHVHLNVGSTVAHDCRLGDYVSLSPGTRLSGDVRLDDEVLLGIGALVIPGRSIGARTVVGAGAVVVRDLPADVTAVGVPARAVGGRARR